MLKNVDTFIENAIKGEISAIQTSCLKISNCSFFQQNGIFEHF